MKEFIKGCGKGSRFLLLLMVIILVTSLVVVSSIVGNNRLRVNNRGYVRDCKGMISITEGKEPAEVIESINEGILVDQIIRKENVCSDSSVIGLYSRETNVHPRVSEGRYFTPEELENGQKVAVVGDKQQEKISVKGAKKYIDIDGENYEVVGIAKDYEPSKIDSLIFIPLVCAYNNNPNLIVGDYILDSDTQDEATSSLEVIKRSLNKKGYLSFVEKSDEIESGNVFDKLSGGNRVNQVYVAIVISMFLAFISVLIYWLKYKENEIEVERIFGNSIWGCFAGIILKYIILFVIATAFSLIIYGLLVYNKLVYWVDNNWIATVILLINVPVVIFLFGKCIKVCKMGWENSFRSGLSYMMLVLQFAVFFYLLCEIGTYYVNISSLTWVDNNKKGYQFYSLMPNVSAETDKEATSKQEEAFIREKNTIKALNKQTGFSFHSINIEESIQMEKTVAESKMADNWKKFTEDANEYRTDEEFTPAFENKEGKEVVSLSVTRANKNASDFYFSKMDKGAALDSNDFELELEDGNKKTVLNVLMGYDYEKYFDEGEEWCTNIGGVEVIIHIKGFLQKDVTYYSDKTYDNDNYLITMNKRIIMPYYDMQNTKFNYEQYIFGLYNYGNYPYGTLVYVNDVTKQERLQCEKNVNKIFLENNMVSPYFLGQSPGVKTFQSTTELMIRIITALYFMAVLFSIISLCICIINQWKKKLPVYAVEIINGRNYKLVIFEYVSKISIVFIAALIISAYFQRINIENNIEFLLLMGSSGIIVCFICSSVVYILSKKLDVEQEVRGKFV